MTVFFLAAMIGAAGIGQPSGGTVFDPISYHFESGSTRLNENSRTRLDELARAAHRESRYRLLLVGHTDSTGSPARNLILSCRRARAVRAHLVEQGIPGERILIEGRGDTRRLVDHGQIAGEADNRRVDVLFVDDRLLAEWRSRTGRGIAC